MAIVLLFLMASRLKSRAQFVSIINKTINFWKFSKTYLTILLFPFQWFRRTFLFLKWPPSLKGDSEKSRKTWKAIIWRVSEVENELAWSKWGFLLQLCRLESKSVKSTGAYWRGFASLPLNRSDHRVSKCNQSKKKTQKENCWVSLIWPWAFDDFFGHKTFIWVGVKSSFKHCVLLLRHRPIYCIFTYFSFFNTNKRTVGPKRFVIFL